MIISADAEKAFDEIQHSFRIKNSYQSDYRGYLWQTATDIILKEVKNWKPSH